MREKFALLGSESLQLPQTSPQSRMPMNMRAIQGVHNNPTNISLAHSQCIEMLIQPWVVSPVAQIFLVRPFSGCLVLL